MEWLTGAALFVLIIGLILAVIVLPDSRIPPEAPEPARAPLPPHYRVVVNGEERKWDRILKAGSPDPHTEWVKFTTSLPPWSTVKPGDRVQIFDGDILVFEHYAYGQRRYAVVLGDDPTVHYITTGPETTYPEVARLARALPEERVGIMDVGTGIWRNFTLEA